MYRSAVACEHALVDAGERHVGVRHNVRALCDEPLCRLHRSRRVGHRLRIGKIGARVDHTLRDHCFLHRQRNPPKLQFFLDDGKAALLYLLRHHILDSVGHCCRLFILFAVFHHAASRHLRQRRKQALILLAPSDRNPVISPGKSPVVAAVADQNPLL